MKNRTMSCSPWTFIPTLYFASGVPYVILYLSLFTNNSWVAQRIIDDAARKLTKATATVIDAIFSHNTRFEVVTTGSVWQAKSRIRDKFTASVLTMFPSAKVIFPRYEPAYGAALLALQRLAEKEI